MNIAASVMFALIDVAIGMCFHCHRDNRRSCKMLQNKERERENFDGSGQILLRAADTLQRYWQAMQCIYNRRNDGSFNDSRVERKSAENGI